MLLPFLLAAKCTILIAAVNCLVRAAYVCLVRWNATVPFNKDGQVQSIRSWVSGVCTCNNKGVQGWGLPDFFQSRRRPFVESS